MPFSSNKSMDPAYAEVMRRTRPKTSKRTPEIREMDRVRICQLLREGWTKTAIAKELHIPVSRIYSDWQHVLKELQEARDTDANALIDIKLEELSLVKREAWEGWKRSKTNRITEVSKEKNRVPADPKKAMLGAVTYEKCSSSETRSGDSSFLQIILDALRQEIQLRGLNPVKQMHVTGSIVNWDILASGIPKDNVPDEIENEIKKALLIDGTLKDENTILVSRQDSSSTTTNTITTTTELSTSDSSMNTGNGQSIYQQPSLENGDISDEPQAMVGRFDIKEDEETL